jgi:predicted RNA-binding protein with PUA-like domain
MPAYWILKTEPSTYSFDQLEQDGRTVWEGVKNAQALIHIRNMQAGDQALIYHSGAGKSLVGTARIATGPYPDPSAGDPRLVVVDIEAGRRLAREVPLSEIKADPAFADLGLVRQGRLSVVPVPPDQWKRLVAMSRGSRG